MMMIRSASRRIVGPYNARVTMIGYQQLLIHREKAAGPVYRLLSTHEKEKEGSMYLVQAGLPMFLFCGLGVWVVSNGIEGKNRERDVFQGRISKSERQALADKEHDEMMDKLNHIMKEDFDNTKRIERPEEVLARRRKEREDRNVWYRRLWRSVTGQR